MLKRLVLCIVVVLAVVSSAFGEVEMWFDDCYFIASLKDGKADYSDARFGYISFSVGNTGLTLTKENMSLTGSITLSGGSYSFWNGSEMQKVSGTPQTFRLAIPTWQVVGDEAEFSPFTDTGGDLRLGLEAESGMKGVNLSWNFPDMPSLNGTYTVPNLLTTREQLDKHVVYFEFIRSGENVTGINWRIVKASDTSTPVELDYPVNFLRFRVWNNDEERILNVKPDFYIEPGRTPEGTYTFDSPIKESDIWRVSTKFYTYDEEAEKCYEWYYYTSSTQSGLYLWSRHSSEASLVNGKSSYNDAKFSDVEFYVPNSGKFICEAAHLTDAGRITIPGGGYTIKDAYTEETLGTVASGTDMTFKLKNDIEASLGKTYIEYSAANDSGRRIHFGGGADTGLNGKTITWTFPAELNLNGSGTVPNYKSTAEQLISGVPYLEIVSEDGYITALKYKMVTASDTSTAITPSYDTDFRLYVDRDNTEDVSFTFYESGRMRNTASGTWTLDTPQPLSTMYRLRVRLYRYEDGTDNPAIYQWSFYPASADPAPVPTTLTITTTTLPSGTTGTPYTAQLASTPSGATWAVSSGTLPAGLTLSSSGTLTGTPTTEGTYSFTLTATLDTQTASRNFTITITTAQPATPANPGSSGGGCSTGLPLAAITLAASLLLTKKR